MGAGFLRDPLPFRKERNMIYQLDGSERKEVTREKIPCGVCVTTSYFDSTNKLLRRDIDIEVDPQALTTSTSISTLEETGNGHHPGGVQQLQDRDFDSYT